MENSNGHTKVKNSLTRRFSRTCSGFHQIDTLLVRRRLFLFFNVILHAPFFNQLLQSPLTSRRHGAIFALKVHLSASWLRMRAENPESNRGIFPFHVESRPSWGMRRANGISLARKTLFKRCIDARFFFSNRDMECICYALWIVYVECLLCVECRMQRWKASNAIEMLLFLLFSRVGAVVYDVFLNILYQRMRSIHQCKINWQQLEYFTYKMYQITYKIGQFA